MKEALVVALKDGPPEQRLEMIRVLRDMGADAKEFAPQLAALLGDVDPRVRAAAAEALKTIDPDAAAKAGVK
jgi:HEAT repeat protein